MEKGKSAEPAGDVSRETTCPICGESCPQGGRFTIREATGSPAEPPEFVAEVCDACGEEQLEAGRVADCYGRAERLEEFDASAVAGPPPPTLMSSLRALREASGALTRSVAQWIKRDGSKVAGDRAAAGALDETKTAENALAAKLVAGWPFTPEEVAYVVSFARGRQALAEMFLHASLETAISPIELVDEVSDLAEWHRVARTCAGIEKATPAVFTVTLADRVRSIIDQTGASAEDLKAACAELAQ